MLSRRKLLQLVGLVATAPAVVIKTADTRPFHWSGWKQPSNQLVQYGWWWAMHPRKPEEFLVSVTNGVLQHVPSEFHMLDITISACETADVAKQTALDKLVANYEEELNKPAS